MIDMFGKESMKGRHNGDGWGEPTRTLVPCWMPKPLPCMGWFAQINGDHQDENEQQDDYEKHQVNQWMMDEFIHWPKPYLLSSTTCDEIVTND
jgi:hypothetical protein